MPTFNTKYLYRLWCKKCNDFTLHEELNDNSNCSCGQVYSNVKISEINKEKLIEQRERFKNQELTEFNDLMSMMTNKLNPISMFSNDAFEVKTKIIESDAGLKSERKRKIEIKEKLKEEAEIELSKFKGIQRNDKCICKSGLKYKKCCKNKCDILKETYNL